MNKINLNVHVYVINTLYISNFFQLYTEFQMTDY